MIMYLMKTPPLYCRGKGLKKKLFNVQGTVENSSARAMDRPEKDNFLYEVVTRTLHAFSSNGFSPCKFV